MFIHIEFLRKTHEASPIDIMVSTPRDAFNVGCMLEKSEDVMAWKLQ